jgi:hypothetical protein
LTLSIAIFTAANSFIENKDNSTILLSPSWKTHFLIGLDPLNMLGDHNVVKYMEAIDIQANVDTKMKYQNNNHNLILVTTNNKQVTVLCNLKNHGALSSTPSTK